VVSEIVRRAQRAEYMRRYRDRKRAEGYRIVRGNLVLGPPAPRRVAAPHGTSAYHYGCRCDECRAANAAAQRRYRAKRAGRSTVKPDGGFFEGVHGRDDREGQNRVAGAGA